METQPKAPGSLTQHDVHAVIWHVERLMLNGLQSTMNMPYQ